MTNTYSLVILNKVTDQNITPDKRYNVSLDDISIMINNPQPFENKEDAPYIFPFVTKPNCIRGKDSAESCDLLFFDYDGGITFDEARDFFNKRGFKFYMYTSFRHQQNGIDKFRVIVPMKKRFSADIYKERVYRNSFAKVYKGLDKNAWKVSGYYIPSYPKGDKSKYRCYESNNEKLFDISLMLNTFKNEQRVINIFDKQEKIKREKRIREMEKGKKFNVANYKTVRRYIDTPFTQVKGNGNSNTWLFAALCTAIQHNDTETLNTIIAKAMNERWTRNEIDNKIKTIMNKHA